MLWYVFNILLQIVKFLLYLWTYPSWYLVAFLAGLLSLILYQCFSDVQTTNLVRDRSATLPGRSGRYNVPTISEPLTPSQLALATNPIGDKSVKCVTAEDKNALLQSIRIFGDGKNCSNNHLMSAIIK